MGGLKVLESGGAFMGRDTAEGQLACAASSCNVQWPTICQGLGRGRPHTAPAELLRQGLVGWSISELLAFKY